MSAFEADRFNHSRTSPENQLSIVSNCLLVKTPLLLFSNFKTLAAISKKFLHNFRRASGQYPAPDYHLVVQSGVVHHLEN